MGNGNLLCNALLCSPNNPSQELFNFDMRILYLKIIKIPHKSVKLQLSSENGMQRDSTTYSAGIVARYKQT